MVTETKVIAPTTLGRYKAEIESVNTATKKELKAMGFDSPDDAMLATKKSIALRLKVSIAELDALFDALQKSHPNAGKRESDKNSRDALIVQTQDMLSVVNLAVACKRGQVKLTDAEKVKAFDALGEFGEVLTDNLLKSFAPIGGMSMFWNPQCQVATASDGLAVYIGGWEDGSNKPRYQYAPRKCPISKRSGYRVDSFDVPMFKVVAKAVKKVVKKVTDAIKKTATPKLEATPEPEIPATPEPEIPL